MSYADDDRLKGVPSEFVPLTKMVMSKGIKRPVNMDDYVMTLATPAQIDYMRSNIHTCPAGLEQEDFYKIETELGTLPYAQKTLTWVLVPKAETDGTCIHSFAVLVDEDAFLAIPGQPIARVPCVYAASFATVKDLRGNGFANQLLVDMIQHIRPSKNEYLLLNLTSTADKLYDKFFDRWKNAIKCSVDIQHQFPFEKHELPEVRPLRIEDIPQVCEADTQILKDRIEEYIERTGKICFVVIPSASTLTCRATRSVLYLRCRKGRDQSLPDEPDWNICGAQINKPGDKDYAFIIWRITLPKSEWHLNSLSLARLHFTNTKQLQALLTAALNVIQRWGLLNLDCYVDVQSKVAMLELGVSVNERGVNQLAPYTRIDYGGDGYDKMPAVRIPHDYVCSDMYFAPTYPL